MSMKKYPFHSVPISDHCEGMIGNSLNACFMSILHIKLFLPMLYTRSVTASNPVYWTVKSSLSISSFIELPLGCDRSRINLCDPSSFIREPIGEQCKFSQGGVINGPAMCLFRNSFAMAFVMPSGWSSADFRFFGREIVAGLLKPISNPLVSPCIKYDTMLVSGCFVSAAKKLFIFTGVVICESRALLA